eukprot:jgi/Botrbrau1/3875/Bobra.0183s0099.1
MRAWTFTRYTSTTRKTTGRRTQSLRTKKGSGNMQTKFGVTGPRTRRMTPYGKASQCWSERCRYPLPQLPGTLSQTEFATLLSFFEHTFSPSVWALAAGKNELNVSLSFSEIVLLSPLTRLSFYLL